MRKKIFLSAFIFILTFYFSGCAATMALRQPTKKNLTVLTSGTSRDNVITYLGAPASSEQKDGKRVDIYQFTQGYSGSLKATRALGHITADLLTLFIWELVGMPIEAIANGNKMTIKVTYGSDDRLEDFIYLQQTE